MINIVSIIPTHNRKNTLRILLKQLFNQALKGVQLNIVIVIDGSTDGTIEMLAEEFPNVHSVIGTGDWWYTKSMNEGFKYAQKLHPDYVLTLNDDLELSENYILSIVDALQTTGGEGIIGSISFTKNEPHLIINSGISRFIRWRLKSVSYIKAFTEVNPESLAGIFPSIMLPGRGMLIPNHCLLDLDFFDERFKQYHSDTDFCLRARKRNYLIFINWRSILYTSLQLSSSTSSFVKTAFISFFKSFFKPFSRRYLPNMALLIWRHTPKILFPLTFTIHILASFKSFFLQKKIIIK